MDEAAFDFTALCADVPDETRLAIKAATFVSLGTSCRVSWMLKSLGLKRASYPFDWLGTTPEMVIDIIANRFVDFLDNSHFAPVYADGLRARQTDHALYRERYLRPVIFSHHDLADPESYKYYGRCVRRFKELKNCERLVFVMATDYALSPSSITDLQEAAKNLEMSPYFVLIHLNAADKTALTPMAEKTFDCRGGCMFEFFPTSEWAPLTYQNPIDDEALGRLILAAAAMTG